MFSFLLIILIDFILFILFPIFFFTFIIDGKIDFIFIAFVLIPILLKIGNYITIIKFNKTGDYNLLKKEAIAYIEISNSLNKSHTYYYLINLLIGGFLKKRKRRLINEVNNNNNRKILIGHFLNNLSVSLGLFFLIGIYYMILHIIYIS